MASSPAGARSPWRVADVHLILSVRATPRARRDAIERVEALADGRAALRVRLKAPPVEGEANEALRRLLAKQFGLRLNEIDIIGGETSRLKTLRLPLSALPALEALVANL